MPPLIVTDSSYQFVPPHEGNLWPRLLSWYAMRLMKSRFGITELEIRDADKLASLVANGDGILLAPNHCRTSDSLVLQGLSRKIGQPFFVMASSHLFRGSRFMKWVLRRTGAFSVYREGLDRQALDTAIDILVKGKRPLVVFPEGALSQSNDRLNALMDGVSFIARTAARKLEKQSAEPRRQVYMVPIAIRFLFVGDLKQTVSPMLEEIERRLSWRTQSDLPLVERIYKVGNALLGLKETEYLGNPQPGDIAQRLQGLIDQLLCPLETEWLKGRKNESVINRVKELRRVIVPDMIDHAHDSKPLTQTELDRRWRQLEDMELAQTLSLYPKEYIASKPTVDRILETVERMAENLSGQEQAHGPMKVIVQIGDPFPVTAKRDRSGTGDPILNGLETQLTSMLAGLSDESRMHEDTAR